MASLGERTLAFLCYRSASSPPKSGHRGAPLHFTATPTPGPRRALCQAPLAVLTSLTSCQPPSCVLPTRNIETVLSDLPRESQNIHTQTLSLSALGRTNQALCTVSSVSLLRSDLTCRPGSDTGAGSSTFHRGRWTCPRAPFTSSLRHLALRATPSAKDPSFASSFGAILLTFSSFCRPPLPVYLCLPLPPPSSLSISIFINTHANPIDS